MERLTMRTPAGGVILKFSGPFVDSEIHKRLTDLEKIHAAIEYLAEIEDILGDYYNFDRFRELMEADRDGRCVVLLRKPYYKLYSGEEIYIVEDGEVYMDHVQEVDLSESDHEKNKVEAWYYTGNDFPFTEREWGKTVFPTREAAEAALKGEE